jgi:hypothetical protein
MILSDLGRPARFTATLIDINGIHPDRFGRWVFGSGMRFGSPDKWWGDLGRRDFPHEGIDFCLFADRTGHVHQLGPGTRIPAMHAGIVRSVFRDYLGKAIVVAHAAGTDILANTVSIYAHTQPLDWIGPGAVVSAGDVIATIADTRGSKAGIPAHLHYTLGVSHPQLDLDAFAWNDMRDARRFRMHNPSGVIDWPIQILDDAMFRQVMAALGRGEPCSRWTHQT